MSESLSKLNGYGVLVANDERLSKLNGYGVLTAIDLRLSKLVAYAVLTTPPTPPATSATFVCVQG